MRDSEPDGRKLCLNHRPFLKPRGSYTENNHWFEMGVRVRGGYSNYFEPAKIILLKTTYSMIPFIGNAQGWQTHRDRKKVSG